MFSVHRRSFACKHVFFVKRVITWSVSSSGPVLVITEYCSLGDLLNFLRQKAETFVNFVMNIPDIMENSNDYKNICNQKQFIRRYVTKMWSLEKAFSLCFCWHPTLSISLFLFPSISDSGISSTSSNTYLEMRPSQPANMESSRGKKLFFHPVPV